MNIEYLKSLYTDMVINGYLPIFIIFIIVIIVVLYVLSMSSFNEFKTLDEKLEKKSGKNINRDI
jgi:hypothetical protein